MESIPTNATKRKSASAVPATSALPCGNGKSTPNENQCQGSPDQARTSSLDPGCKLSSDNAHQKQFYHWKRKTKSRAIVLLNKEDPSQTKVIVARFGSRFFPEGQKLQKIKLLSKLSKEKKFGVLLTLTVNPADFEHRHEAVSMIWVKHKLFKDRLNMRLKRAGLKPLRAVAVLEFTKQGWPHLHLWCPGRHYIAPQRELQELWGAIVDVRKVSSSASKYVVKYVTKLHRLPDRDQAALWKRRTRTYTMSRLLYRAARVSERREPQWTVLGTVWGQSVASSDRDPRLSDLARDGPPLKYRGLNEALDYELGAILDELRGEYD